MKDRLREMLEYHPELKDFHKCLDWVDGETRNRLCDTDRWIEAIHVWESNKKWRKICIETRCRQHCDEDVKTCRAFECDKIKDLLLAQREFNREFFNPAPFRCKLK